MVHKQQRATGCYGVAQHRNSVGGQRHVEGTHEVIGAQLRAGKCFLHDGDLHCCLRGCLGNPSAGNGRGFHGCGDPALLSQPHSVGTFPRSHIHRIADGQALNFPDQGIVGVAAPELFRFSIGIVGVVMRVQRGFLVGRFRGFQSQCSRREPWARYPPGSRWTQCRREAGSWRR